VSKKSYRKLQGRKKMGKGVLTQSGVEKLTVLGSRKRPRVNTLATGKKKKVVKGKLVNC